MSDPSPDRDAYGFLSAANAEGYPDEGPNPLIKHPTHEGDQRQSAENDARAGEVWQEADNVLLLCVAPGHTWQDFNGHTVPWDAPTIDRPLRRLLDSAGNLVPEYARTSVIPPGEDQP